MILLLLTLAVIATAMLLFTHRRRLALIVLAIGVLAIGVIAPSAAFAAAPPTPADPGTPAEALFELDAFTVAALFGVVIPIIGGIILKASASRSVQSLVNLVLSTVASVVAIATTDGGGAVFSESLIKTTVLTFVISVATLYGVWKPTGVDAALVNSPGVIGSRAKAA